MLEGWPTGWPTRTFPEWETWTPTGWEPPASDYGNRSSYRQYDPYVARRIGPPSPPA